MNKVLLLFFIGLFFSLTSVAQTYTIKIFYTKIPDDCTNSELSWELKGDNVRIGSFQNTQNNVEFDETETYSLVPNYSNFSLRYRRRCGPDCDRDVTQSRTASQLITGPGMANSTCDTHVRMTSFKPDLILVPGTHSVPLCMGEEIILNGFPENRPAGSTDDFPDVAYSWQYSLNGTTAWNTIPSAVSTSNNVRILKATMQAILGGNHRDYLNTTIHFRLGGGLPSKAYSSTYSITYSPCSPLLENVEPKNTSCSNSKDGWFRLQFDSLIDAGDIMDLGLFPLLSSGELGPQEQKFITRSDFETIGSKHYYNWKPKEDDIDINPGNYVIKYQYRKGGSIPAGFEQYPNTLTINSPNPVTFAVIPYDISCATNQGVSNNGGVTINAFEGTGSYKYSLDGGASFISFPGNSNSIDVSMDAGPYSVQVEDSNGCTGTSGGKITVTGDITQPNPINISGTPTPATAFGVNNGSISASVTGGTPALSYSWSGPSGFSSNQLSISSLYAGTYTLTVTDANGCSTNQNFVVNEPPLFEFVTQNSVNVSCGDNDPDNDNGSITVRATGGLTNYRYELFKRNPSNTYVSTGDIQTLTPTVDFQIPGLSAGFYRVTVTDNNGAGITISADFQITVPAVFSFSTTKTDVVCKGQATGSIDLTISGGNTAAYNISWSGNGTTYTTADLSNIPAGIYTLTLTDALGCTPVNVALDYIVEITEPATAVTVVVSPNGIQAPTFNGASDGSISIDVSDGTPGYTYLWTKDGDAGFTRTTQDITALSDGIYNITVTDNLGCSDIITGIIVAEPDPLLVSISLQTEILCFAGANATGALRANPTGGVPNPTSGYTYNWFIQDNTNAFVALNEFDQIETGLTPGTYRVEVTDNNTISAFSAPFELLGKPEIVIANVLTTAVNCFGGSDGSIVITATGGTAALQYSINNGATYQSSNTFSDLAEGDYQILVRDANLCPTPMQQHTVSAPTDPIAITPTLTQVLIFGQNTGAIAIDVTGGNTGYTYSWSGPNGFSSTNEDLNTLFAGTYTLTVTDNRFNSTTDNSGCSITTQYTITQPDQLIAVIDYQTPGSDLQCYNDDNARLLASVTGGVQGYSYTWEKESFIGSGIFDLLSDTSALLIGADAGNYRVTITDANGASTTDEFIVTQPDALAIAFTQTDVLCFGDSTGAIDSTPSGGTPPYTYLWSNGEVTQNLTAVPAGQYTLTLNDANNCSLTASVITITQPNAPISITQASITNLTGFQTDNGAISVTADGGAPGYTYQWRVQGTTTIIGTVASINNLQAGTYELTITDANNCNLVDAYTVTQPDLLEVSITYPAMGGVILCNGDATARLQTIVTGGVPFLEGTPDAYYTYQWINQNDPATTIGTNASIENLSAGAYSVTVIDANGNTATPVQDFIVTQPDPLTITIIAQQDPLCFNGTDGSISVQAAGGTLHSGQDYTYSWSSGQSGNTVTGITAGEYTVTAFDSNGCALLSQGITLGQPNPLFIQNITITQPSSNGATDGNVTITVVGGTPAYTYQWFDQNDVQLPSTTNTLNNIGEGEYFVTITDAQGCQIIRRSIHQTQPDPLVVAIAQINEVRCNGEATASLRAITTGGVPFLSGSAYAYQWFNNNTTLIGAQATISNLSIGGYYVIVTDANGNIAQSTTFTITQPEIVEVSLTAEFTLCGDGNDWSIQSSVSGGTPPYTYLWNNGNGTTADIANVLPGTYALTVQDSRGCTAQQSITLTPPQSLEISSVTTDPTCFSGSDGAIDITPTGGTPPYTYTWSNGITTADNTALTAGVYILQITDSKGCTITRDFELTNPEELIIDLGADKTLCLGQSYTIDAAITDPMASYRWEADNGFTANTSEVTLTDSGTYTVFVTTALGCVSTDTIEIIALQNQIHAKFLVSTDLFVDEPFVMVDVSNPAPDSIEWILPEAAQLIDSTQQYAELSFTSPGEYAITLKTTIGDCEAIFTKTITIREPAFDNDTQDKEGLQEYLLYPNPTSGNFTVTLTFDTQTPIDIKLFSVANNALLSQYQNNGKEQYTIPYNLEGSLPSGVYFLLLQTPHKNYVRKIVVE